MPDIKTYRVLVEGLAGLKPWVLDYMYMPGAWIVVVWGNLYFIFSEKQSELPAMGGV